MLKALATRNALNTADIDDVIWSTSSQRGKQGGDLGRMAALDAGFDIEVSGVKSAAPPKKKLRVRSVLTKLVQRRRTLLDGISSKVVELLRDRSVNPETFKVLKSSSR